MSAFVVIATVHAKLGQADQLRPHLQALIAPTLPEDGCLRYELNESEDTGRWIFVEQWASTAHLDAHLKTAHFARFKADADHLIGWPTSMPVLRSSTASLLRRALAPSPPLRAAVTAMVQDAADW